MDRIVDAGRFVAEGAVVDWRRVIAEQEVAARRSDVFTRPESKVRPQRDGHDAKFGGPLQLRWYVSESAGVPRVPFTVWIRRDRDKPQRIDATTSFDGDDSMITWGNVPMVTVSVDCEPVDAGRPCALWGFRRGGDLVSAVAVSQVATGQGPHSLQIRAGSITYARLVNARVRSVRVVPTHDVVTSDAWERFEIVGLPYDSNAWSSTNYEGKEQGMVDALTDPFTAAVERLERAAPRAGWWPSTETGHLAPGWDAPAPGQLVKEIRETLLAQVGELFDPSVTPAQQHDLRIVQVADPPTQDGRVAAVTTSKVTLPPFGALVVPATTDPFVSLGTGFGTGYELGGVHEIFEHVDWMVTATYPEGVTGAGPEEYAWVVPWPDVVAHMTPPGNLRAVRAGLTAPVLRDAPWRETVSLEWDALPRSVLFGRAVGAAAAVFDPATTTEATALLERHDSGGWRPLVPQRQLDPRSDRVIVNDRARELPTDGTDLTSGYAVAQQDPFGVWSQWEDVIHTSAEPNQPVPVISEFTALSRFTGTTNCPTDVVVVITVDWSARTPAFVQVPVVMWPAAHVGAPDPSGLTPFGSPPLGGQRVDLTMRFLGDTPDSLVAGLIVECLAADSEDVVAAGAAQGPGSRRYRLTYSALSLSFTSTAHWALAAWARELVVGGQTAWGATSPVPAHTFASSPVPIMVPSVPLPVVPLGGLPDSDGRSHVSLRLSGLPGAATIVVWSAGEVRVRDAAAIGPIPPDRTLSERFVELKAAFTALSPALKREVFSRADEFPAGSATTRDFALPRGSREITLFAVTAVTPANIESPWPSDIDQLQAAAAPTVVTPGVPDLSAAFVDTVGGPRIELSMAIQSPLDVTTFEVYRTFIGEAALSSATMGPPVATATVDAVVGAGTPAGDRFEATHVDTSVGDWRPVHFRVVAVPTLVTADRERGIVTRRSLDSSLASLLLPPADPPSLTLVDVDEWGPTSTGVRIRVRTDAPLGPHPLGSFDLSAAATLADGSSVASVVVDLAEVAAGSSTTPPADAALGDVSRDASSGGQTAFGLWFERPLVTDEVTCRITLTDPLGRHRDLNVVVPAGSASPPPSVHITGVVRSGTAVVVLFDTDAPETVGPGGPHILSVRVGAALFGGSASVAMAVPDVPDADDLGPNPAGRLVIARRRLGRDVDYGALVRVGPRFDIAISVTDPEGRTGSAHRRVN